MPGVFFVAPNGNDQWSGQRASPNWRRKDGPFATPGRALEAARAFKTAGRGDRSTVTIFFRNGRYPLEQPLTLTPEDSNIVLAAYAGEKPVLSGGRRLEGWRELTVGGKPVWAAEAPGARDGKWTFRELWVNGNRAVRARHPNRGYLKLAELPDKAEKWTAGHKRFRVKAGDLQPGGGIAGAEVVVMTKWVESRLPISSLESKDNLLNFAKRSVFALAPGDLYYAEGALDFLDQPGEWCLDRAAGRVYYWPRPGESLKTLEAIAPVLAHVVRFEGRPEADQFIERVTFRGLGFAHTEWNLPEGVSTGKEDTLFEPRANPEVGGFVQAAIGVPGAIQGRGLRDCVIEDCTIAHLGTYGLEFTRGCQRNRILGCSFFDLGAGGIKLGETIIRARAAEQTRQNEIRDCDIRDGGKMYHSAIGIWIGHAPENRIAHNEIHDFYYTGISIGWTWGYGASLAGGNIVEFNHVHHIGAKSDGDGPILSDMAGIYTLGMQPGTVIRNNLWHDIAATHYGGWGIYFDEGSCSIIAENNLVYRTTHGGFHQHYGATNTVRNNIFAFARDYQVQRTRTEPHISFSFQTNVVYFDTGVLVSGDWSDNNFKLDRNVYFDARPGAKADAPALGYGSWQQWRQKGHDRNSIIADPLFVAPREGNFSLRPDSPALKMGFRPLRLDEVGPRRAR
jgi:hypothetical protein